MSTWSNFCHFTSIAVLYQRFEFNWSNLRYPVECNSARFIEVVQNLKPLSYLHRNRGRTLSCWKHPLKYLCMLPHKITSLISRRSQHSFKGWSSAEAIIRYHGTELQRRRTSMLSRTRRRQGHRNTAPILQNSIVFVLEGTEINCAVGIPSDSEFLATIRNYSHLPSIAPDFQGFNYN